MLSVLGVLLCFFYAADSDSNVNQEEYFMESEIAAEYYKLETQSQIPLAFADIFHFDQDSSISISPSTTLSQEPLLYRYNHQYHRKEIPFLICSSLCVASESSLSIYYLTDDIVESSRGGDRPPGYCRIDVNFKSDEFLIKTNIPGSEEYNQTIIGDDKCYFFIFDMADERKVQLHITDNQKLPTSFPICSFKIFKENEPSKFSQILLKTKISNQECSYKFQIMGEGNFMFRKPPKPTLQTTSIPTKKSTTPPPTTIAQTFAPHEKTEITSTQKQSLTETPEDTIQIANIVLYSVAGGVGISIVIFIIACIWSTRKRKNKKQKFQKSLTPKTPSMELDSTQTMPVIKSSSQQVQVPQQPQPPTVQQSRSHPVHTAKLKKSTLKSNRVSKLPSDFQHLPSKSQSRQKVLTLSLNQNVKPRPNKKASKGGTKEKKDSYGNTTVSGGHSKKINQLKTASTFDQY